MKGIRKLLVYLHKSQCEIFHSFFGSSSPSFPCSSSVQSVCPRNGLEITTRWASWTNHAKFVNKGKNAQKPRLHHIIMSLLLRWWWWFSAVRQCTSRMAICRCVHNGEELLIAEMMGINWHCCDFRQHLLLFPPSGYCTATNSAEEFFNWLYIGWM